MAAPITRIIRFVGEDDKVYYGEESKDGGKEVTVLEGGLFPNTMKRTDKKMTVKSLMAPFDPCNVFCIGLNYMKHWEEGAKKRGIPLPTKPVTFMKPTTTITHPGQDVWIPQLDKGDQLDWEVELCMVIGKECKNATLDNALDYVLGYCVGNDVSSRFWQKNAGANQWNKGKSFDRSAPIGPVLVMKEAVKDPNNLQMTTKVNGKLQQNENTKDMIFNCKEIIEWVSKDMTLLPGTLIMTGTPSGIAAGHPAGTQPWLVAGDVVECEITGLGVLSNPITVPPTSNL